MIAIKFLQGCYVESINHLS